jgi:hypothetical protein
MRALLWCMYSENSMIRGLAGTRIGVSGLPSFYALNQPYFLLPFVISSHQHVDTLIRRKDKIPIMHQMFCILQFICLLQHCQHWNEQRRVINPGVKACRMAINSLLETCTDPRRKARRALKIPAPCWLLTLLEAWQVSVARIAYIPVSVISRQALVDPIHTASCSCHSVQRKQQEKQQHHNNKKSIINTYISRLLMRIWEVVMDTMLY